MRISPEELQHYSRVYRQRVAVGDEVAGKFESWLYEQMARKALGAT